MKNKDNEFWLNLAKTALMVIFMLVILVGITNRNKKEELFYCYSFKYSSKMLNISSAVLDEHILFLTGALPGKPFIYHRACVLISNTAPFSPISSTNNLKCLFHYKLILLALLALVKIFYRF